MKLKTAKLSAIILFSYFFTYTLSAEVSASTAETGTPPTPSPTVENDSTDYNDFTELDDLVIVEKKKLVESDGAKLSYNVTEDPEAGNSNLMEILRKVPGVTVDAEDNVKVNGQSNFKILMNGREDPMLKGDLKTILKSLPAATIKKIEVISEPGAKYEAEGTGGILNIVTDRKQNLSGFMTQIQGWINAHQAGGNINARTKIDKVMLDANVSYNDGKIWRRPYKSERITEYLTEETGNAEKLNRTVRSGWDYTGTRFNMSWEPDTLNLLTLSANYGYNTWGGPQEDRRTMFNEKGDVIWDMSRKIKNNGKYNGVGTQASYQHTFGKEGHNLIASYEFDYYHLNYGTEYSTVSQEGISETPYSATHSKGNETWNIFQIDYANPFNGYNLLEAGAKINLNNSRSDSWNNYGDNSENAVTDTRQSVCLSQFKNVYALYASYTATLDKWNLKAGLRYEHTDMGLRYHTTGHNDFSTRLEDLVPNAAVSYNFSPASSLRAAYQMRISRPGLNYMNPFVNGLTPGWITYGNPDLKSEKSHVMSLSYSNFEGKFGGSAKLSYQYVANSITDVIFLKDGLVNSTYANVGKDNMITLELNGNWSITNDLRWSVYLGGGYENIKAESELLAAENHGWFANLNTDLSYTLPCKIRVSGFAGLNTPWIDLQGHGSTGYWYGIGLSKSFLKEDALTISASANNFFSDWRKSKYYQEDRSVRLNQTSCYKPWNVGLSVTWKFGGLKSAVRQTNASIEKEASSEVQRGNK